MVRLGYKRPLKIITALQEIWLYSKMVYGGWKARDLKLERSILFTGQDRKFGYNLQGDLLR